MKPEGMEIGERGGGKRGSAQRCAAVVPFLKDTKTRTEKGGL